MSHHIALDYTAGRCLWCGTTWDVDRANPRLACAEGTCELPPPECKCDRRHPNWPISHEHDCPVVSGHELHKRKLAQLATLIASTPVPLTEEQRHAAGGYYCQNCSRVLMERQGDTCGLCRKLLAEVAATNFFCATCHRPTHVSNPPFGSCCLQCLIRGVLREWELDYGRPTAPPPVAFVCCPECGRRTKTTSDGYLVQHDADELGTPCDGSGHKRKTPPPPKTPAETYWVRAYPNGLWSAALRVDTGWLFPGRESAVHPTLVAEVGPRVEPPTP